VLVVQLVEVEVATTGCVRPFVVMALLQQEEHAHHSPAIAVYDAVVPHVAVAVDAELDDHSQDQLVPMSHLVVEVVAVGVDVEEELNLVVPANTTQNR